MLRGLLTCRDLCFSLPPREPVFRQAKRNSSEMNSHRVGSGLDFPVDFLHLRVSVLLLTTEGNTRNEIRHFPAENYSLSQIVRHRERMDYGRREKRRLMFFFKRIVYPKMKSNLMSFHICITFFPDQYNFLSPVQNTIQSSKNNAKSTIQLAIYLLLLIFPNHTIAFCEK